MFEKYDEFYHHRFIAEIDDAMLPFVNFPYGEEDYEKSGPVRRNWRQIFEGTTNRLKHLSEQLSMADHPDEAT
jgi:hypothetical protein